MITFHPILSQEGLFSDGGRTSEIEDIMNMLDTGGRELPGSTFSVASALLTFLAALADPVVPYALHQRCMECYNNTTLCKQVMINNCNTSINVGSFHIEARRLKLGTVNGTQQYAIT